MIEGEQEQDILVDIPDEDLSKLAEIYKNHQDWAPNVYSTIMTGIEWKKTKKGNYITFLSPNGCWKEDGTFFVVLALVEPDIFYFSLGDGKNICQAFKRTKRLEFSNLPGRKMLYYIHDKLYTPVRNAIKELGKTFISETPCQMFGISSQEALKFQIQCPDDVYIKKLDTADAKLVDSEWPRRYENSEKFVKLLIEMNGAYGIYLKSNNKLASWILLSMMGQLALLQTLEAHKRKGYASVLVKYASKELAKKGYSPYGTVMADNLASKAIFERAGFKYLGIAVFSFYE